MAVQISRSYAWPAKTDSDLALALTRRDFEIVNALLAALGQSGQVTLSSGTANVTFAAPEPNTSYYIALGGSANETFRWSSKATTGFTITSSNGSSTAVVDWVVRR